MFIWIVGFVGVSLADKQLRLFKNSPNRTRAEVCNTGLWKYSRHPNYFFEWVLWLGYLPMGVHSAGGEWLFLIPPILYLFLTKITGIPFVEARKLEASGDAYKKYLESTSSFFPWFPK
jgi:steroid 5-alpha reductase family enzyme